MYSVWRYVALGVVLAVCTAMELSLNVDIKRFVSAFPPPQDQLWSVTAGILVVVLPHISRALSSTLIKKKIHDVAHEKKQRGAYLSGFLALFVSIMLVCGIGIVITNILSAALDAGRMKAAAITQYEQSTAVIIREHNAVTEQLTSARPARDIPVLDGIILRGDWRNKKEQRQTLEERDVAMRTQALRVREAELQKQLDSRRAVAAEMLSPQARLAMSRWPSLTPDQAEAFEPAYKGLFVAAAVVVVPLILGIILFPGYQVQRSSSRKSRARNGHYEYNLHTARASDSAEAWARRALKKGGELSTTEARGAYELWCSSAGVSPASPQAFGAGLKRVCEGLGGTIRRSGNRRRWEGVSLAQK